MKPRLLLQWGAVAGAIALVVILSRGQAQAGTFNPTFTLEGGPVTPEQPTDTVVHFGLPDGDVNFAGVVAFIPGDAGIVKGDTIPDGTNVGHLESDAVLGLVGGPCNTHIPVPFDFQDGSVDTSNTVSFEDTDGNNTRDYADLDANGLYNAVSKYPEWNNRIFPNAGAPIRRSIGITPVAGIPVILQFLVFPPGTFINENVPTDASLGYPSVTVLQNAGDTTAKPEPGAITDFCTPLVTTNTALGTSPDGTVLTVAPQDGTYQFTIISLGLRDADGDGYENSLDTCPYTPNAGNPRVPYSGDADYDGLDSACDPDDNSTNSDQDGDGYLNRQDNCPLVSNGQDTTNQSDPDLDQIGTACDSDPNNPDGQLAFSQLTQTVVVGSGSGPGGPPHQFACPNCYKTAENPPGITAAPTLPPGQTAAPVPTGGATPKPGTSGSVTPKPSGATVTPCVSPKPSGSGAASGSAAAATSPASSGAASGSVVPTCAAASGSPSPSATAKPATKDEGGGLGTGAIIAIVAGATVATAAVAGGGYYLWRRRGM
ncbi:MAG: hypothetical protein E6J42_06400 [Chloroflexi bacterium]|nr:MAG: hypothetical protein E6J42_06400 [Chloroflexota bacterium]